jgi:hypothetical protein
VFGIYRLLGVERERELLALARIANEGGADSLVGGRMQGSRARRRAARRRTARALVVVPAGLLASLICLGAPTSAATEPGPRPFALVFDGVSEPSLGQGNLRRSGAFSATSPVCSFGVADDRRYVYPFGVLREHTCDDGSGSFTALLDPLVAEHGGVGRWKILGGTGRYAGLRGRGSFAGEFVSGSPSEEETIGFRTTWRGLVAFDAAKPVITDLRIAVRVLRHPTYRLHVSFRTRDDDAGNPVEYRVLPTSGSYALPFAEGTTRTQRVSTTLAIEARRPDLPIVVEIRASDPLGNERRLVRAVPLPR